MRPLIAVEVACGVCECECVDGKIEGFVRSPFRTRFDLVCARDGGGFSESHSGI